MTGRRWQARVEKGCLFVDETDSGRVVLQHNARAGMRPYIHPLRGPDGTSCLTEDSPWHHPWQHGVQTGFHGVNGCDFWFDPGQRPGTATGTIEPTGVTVEGDSPLRWRVEAVWRAVGGDELLDERQTWEMGRTGDAIVLDLAWCLTAARDVTIGQGTYGGLFVRMPFREGCEAEVVNSEGQRDDATEQQPARWVDLFMKVNDRRAAGGIAILDHADNDGHPVRWRVDGQRGINPSPCISGPMHAAAGTSLRYRYRLVLHDAQLGRDALDAFWYDFAAKKDT